MGLFGALGQNHSPEHWRLFIGVLLHNGNLHPSIPIVHATKFKEAYENLKLILEKINYATQMWQICSDLKVVGMLAGLEGGIAKKTMFSLPLGRSQRQFFPKMSPYFKIGMNDCPIEIDQDNTNNVTRNFCTYEFLRRQRRRTLK